MTAVDLISIALLAVAGLFFLAGTVGLLRFPDLHSRLHAITKVDNPGLGFTVLALALQADSWATGIELLLIWLLTLGASAASSFLLADHVDTNRETRP